MGKTGDYKAIVKEAVLDESAFVRMTLSRKLRHDDTEWVRVIVRPVMVKGRRRIQFSYFDPRKDITKNYTFDEAGQRLDDALSVPFGDIHVQSTTGDLRVRVGRKGEASVTRSKPSVTAAAPDLAHDREKTRALPADASDPFLRAIGITNAHGKIRPEMQGKFRQINEFLRIIEQVVSFPNSQPPRHEPVEGANPLLLDCGCGNAYLTFAAYHFLAQKIGLPVRLIGVDLNEELVARNQALAASLGWEGIEFRVSAIAEFQPDEPPEMVLSLHACDTATDDAIARGIGWGSRVILAAPCCQHELHDQLKSPVFHGVLRHGILRERLADVLTDAFRALVLRAMGYRTDVIQFVDPEHTAKNLLIRAEKTTRPGNPAALKEYRLLKEFWEVTPAIESALDPRFL